MLHPNAKQRLKRVLPETFDLAYRHPETKDTVETTVDPDIRWVRDEAPAADEYPIIALELSPEGVPRVSHGEQEPQDTYKEYKPTDDTVAYMKYTGKPLYAGLNIIVAVDSGEPMMPARVMADLIAQEAYYQYQFNTDHLTDQGRDIDDQPVPWEWPMAVYQESGEGVVNMNRMRDQQSVQRRAIPFRVDYRFWSVEEIPALDTIAYEFGVDHNYDWEITEEDGEQWFGPYHVDVAPTAGETFTVEEPVEIDTTMTVGEKDA